MHTWHWHTWQGASYLTCSLLKDWAHGFLTQQFWSRPPEELVELLQPSAQVYRVKQVHGDRVLNASTLDPASGSSLLLKTTPAAMPDATPTSTESTDFKLSEADGLFTTKPNQAIWVCTADCTPVLIGDIATGQVAAVHAGWRGTAAAIVPKAIQQLQAQGSQIQDLRIAMGPAIAGEVYQVSTTVAAQVGTTILPDLIHSLGDLSPEDTNEILTQLRQLPNSPILDDPQPGRARLDVRRVNAMQLEQLGIEPEQVAVAPYCTYQNPDLFFSYRRQPQKKVQWSAIVSSGSSKV